MTGRIETKRVLLVGEHVMIRQAFVWILDQEPDLEVAAQAGSLAEGRARVTPGGYFPMIFRLGKRSRSAA